MTRKKSGGRGGAAAAGKVGGTGVYSCPVILQWDPGRLQMSEGALLQPDSCSDQLAACNE